MGVDASQMDAPGQPTSPMGGQAGPTDPAMMLAALKSLGKAKGKAKHKGKKGGKRRGKRK